jgi:hypothetical protein
VPPGGEIALADTLLRGPRGACTFADEVLRLMAAPLDGI